MPPSDGPRSPSEIPGSRSQVSGGGQVLPFVRNADPSASSSGALPAPPPAAAESTSFAIGRETELAKLSELYATALRIETRLAFVEGPSGVGKSRVLQEFRSRVRLDGGIVLDARCEPGRAYGPFAGIVDQALRFLSEIGTEPSFDLAQLACNERCHRFWHLHPDAPDLDASMPVMLPGSTHLSSAVSFERRGLFFDAITALLADVARVRPPVITLQDLDRADTGTLALLEHLLDASTGVAGVRPSFRALFVTSLRATDASASEAFGLQSAAIARLLESPITVRVPLGRLDIDGVRAYLTSPAIVQRVLERTGGHPESIELLLDADPLTPEAQLERRLARLPIRARGLLEALAVVERLAGLELLTGIVGSSIDGNDRTEFARSELVSRSVIDGRVLFSFAREGDRQRVYDSTSAERRKFLHRRCVLLHDEGRGIESVEATHHALLSGDLDRALRIGLSAARSLAQRHAHVEAAALLERVLESFSSVDGVEDRVPSSLREALCDIYRALGEYPKAVAQARALFEREPTDAAAEKRYGQLQFLAGDLDGAGVTLKRAHEAAKGARDRVSAAEIEGLLAELAYQRSDYDAARAWATEVLAISTSETALPLAIQARNTLGKLAMSASNRAEAIKLFGENANHAHDAQLGHLEGQALTNLGIALISEGRYDEAEAKLEAAVQLARSWADARERVHAVFNLGVVAHWRRHYSTALSRYHECVTLAKRLENRPVAARLASNLASLYMSMGDAARARNMAEFALRVAPAEASPGVIAQAHLTLGQAALMESTFSDSKTENRGNEFKHTETALEESRTHLTSVVADAHAGDFRADALLDLVRLELREGDVRRATTYADQIDIGTPLGALARAWVARAKGEDDTAPLRAALLVLDGDSAQDELRLSVLSFLARVSLDHADFTLARRSAREARELSERLSANVPRELVTMWANRHDVVELEAIERELDREARTVVSSSSETGRRLVGGSTQMRALRTMVERVAKTDALVLVRGESGTGKELVADALHQLSNRVERPFVKVNCAALVETLLLSELFGHERGAFTGASARKKGRFEVADGGTIFLDEIGDISPKTQVALLRVLQEREFERVGGTQPIHVNVRIVVATHRDLEQMVRAGSFREDLYYRLRGVVIDLPALRERLDDLPELAETLLHRISVERDEPPKKIADDAIALLRAHRWPGNVRELENVLRSATLFCDAPTLRAVDFAGLFVPSGGDRPHVQGTSDLTDRDEATLIYQKIRSGEASLADMKKNLERDWIEKALTETDGNITRAAALLGMKRPRLSQLVKEYGLAAASELSSTDPQDP